MNNELQTSFAEYARQHQLLTPGNTVLAAVSGGIDSMVMLHLLHAAEVDAAVAHCNFKLRGKESDDDALFVEKKSKEYGFPLHVAHFDTEAYAAQHGLSIQMAARELRYHWFEELAEQNHYHSIATAHNRDDRIETLFINLARGTGIRGLTGMKPKTGKLIRPLLFASREDIAAYAERQGIMFREDSSNAEDKYARNYIRHHIIPGLEQHFPGARQSVERTMDHLAGVEAWYLQEVERAKQQVVSTKDNLMYIDLQGLYASASPYMLLYEILSPLGFPGTAVANMLQNEHREPGQQFFSATHRLVRDRQTFVVQPLEKNTAQKYLIDTHTDAIEAPVKLRFEQFEKYPDFAADRHPHVACVDMQMLQFPLLLRKWERGDAFRPFGMQHTKKLSDFFTDRKLSLIEKEQCWVLLSGKEIVWVVGLRMDDRFKITDDTQQVLRITYLPSS